MQTPTSDPIQLSCMIDELKSLLPGLPLDQSLEDTLSLDLELSDLQTRSDWCGMNNEIDGSATGWRNVFKDISKSVSNTFLDQLRW